MTREIDFLTKEIFVKILTKGLNVLRILYLLYFFGISGVLDNFFFSKSIVGLVIFMIMLLEITYSNQINHNKDNSSFLRVFFVQLNKLLLLLSSILILVSLVFVSNKQLLFHIIVMSIWALLNVNANYFLLVYRYKNKNRTVLLYYLLIAILDLTFICLSLNIINITNSYAFISLSLLLSELIVMFFLFKSFIIFFLKEGKNSISKIDYQKKNLIAIFSILILIGLIEISDRYFLSILGEGSITYYIYGIHAPLMIRQSLDIRTNFFVQLNVAGTFVEAKYIFIKTLKRLTPFYLLATLILIALVNVFEDVIVNLLKIENFLLLKNIIYCGIIITPFYMIWDLFYRFYYRQNEIKRLLILVSAGFSLNIIFNYLFAIELDYGIYGILLSTILIFALYNFISFFLFFHPKPKSN